MLSRVWNRGDSETQARCCFQTIIIIKKKKLFASADRAKALANTANASGHCCGDISKTSFVVYMCLASLPACQICLQTEAV